jgi:hypothetical protein
MMCEPAIPFARWRRSGASQRAETLRHLLWYQMTLKGKELLTWQDQQTIDAQVKRVLLGCRKEER